MKTNLAGSALILLAIGCSPRAEPQPPGPTVQAEEPPGDPDPATTIEPAERARAGEERADNSLGMAFRYCPAGSFRMGSPRDVAWRMADQGPARVTISRGFWIGRCEVTQGQWLKVNGRSQRQQRAQDPTQPRPVGDGSTRDHVGEGADHPIYYVSCNEADAFCRSLNDAERAAGRLPGGWSYRLPTEAQWEYACRAGTTTATAFGDSLDSTRANFDGTHPFHGAPPGPYLRETRPVGSYPPNPWGLHDMHGNVCEWCRDGYAETLAGGSDPLGPAQAPRRAFRGGGWDLRGIQCIAAFRSGVKHDARGSGLGFRVALVPEGR